MESSKQAIAKWKTEHGMQLSKQALKARKWKKPAARVAKVKCWLGLIPKSESGVWFHLSKDYDYRREGALEHARHRSAEKMRLQKHEQKLLAKVRADQQHAKEMLWKEMEQMRAAQKQAFNDQEPPGDS